MTEDEALKLQAACWERYTLLNQAARKHEENVRAELRRYEEELKQLDTTFAIRLGRDLSWTTPPES